MKRISWSGSQTTENINTFGREKRRDKITPQQTYSQDSDNDGILESHTKSATEFDESRTYEFLKVKNRQDVQADGTLGAEYNANDYADTDVTNYISKRSGPRPFLDPLLAVGAGFGNRDVERGSWDIYTRQADCEFT